MTKKSIFWAFALFAAALVGGMIGNHHGYDGAVWGVLWGVLAFLCIRVWIGIRRSGEDEASHSVTRDSAMMTQGEAKRYILGLWPAWAEMNLDAERQGRSADAKLFFAFLIAQHPNLLEFSYSGPDKLEIVHQWLSRARYCEKLS